MTNCTQESFQFPVLKRRIVEANFQGGDITSDGGVLLLQQVDRRLGLSEAVARTLDDPRRQASIDHNSLSLLRQRAYALALGYEDLTTTRPCAWTWPSKRHWGAPRNWPMPMSAPCA